MSSFRTPSTACPNVSNSLVTDPVFASDGTRIRLVYLDFLTLGSELELENFNNLFDCENASKCYARLLCRGDMLYFFFLFLARILRSVKSIDLALSFLALW
mmetsp:Transcript_24358/g.65128  ORF Transcript_24358/g.65128 Transcript_24358/m.65128 type:complete len:101 (-) Transcript_24358:18-320(-)